jgi:hypothetical protein
MAKLVSHIEIEELELIGLGVNQNIPCGNVTVSDSQVEIEVVDGLEKSLAVGK